VTGGHPWPFSGFVLDKPLKSGRIGTDQHKVN
jgi:hypothetical protein